MITENEILTAQKLWGDGIVAIGKVFTDGGDYRARAGAHIDKLYSYAQGPVLFKPTKAAENQFRGSREDALSYFVGGHIAEDQGFAIAPWSDVRFENHDIILMETTALAMGNYFFTATNGDVIKVEYTFGYIKDEDGVLRIILHHSSVPYSA